MIKLVKRPLLSLKRIAGLLLVLSFLLQVSFLLFAASQVDTSREDELLKAALESIEKNRKGTAEIRLVDHYTGQPVKQADVTYAETTHDFIFGSFESALVVAEQTGTVGLWSSANGGWVHIGLSWRESILGPGVFDFRRPDSWLDYLEKEHSGTQFVAQFFDLTPQAWAGVEPPDFVDFYGIAEPQVFENYRHHLYDFVYHVVEHYRDRIRYWVTQNELNRPAYVMGVRGLTKPLWTINQAFEIANTTAAAIRRANPDAMIILAGSPPNSPYEKDDWINSLDPRTFAKEAVRRGIDFDAFSIQFYPFVNRPAWLYGYLRDAQSIGKSV